MVKKKRRTIFALLVFIIFLQACRGSDIPIVSPQITETTPSTQSPLPDISPVTPKSQGNITIRYVSDSTVNPITSLSMDNILLSSLLYECLFVMDNNLTPSMELCESWSTEDNITYTFQIKDNISMSDGTMLTADDVAYSLRQAMQRGRFVNRLSTIRSISTSESLMVTIVLNQANRNFINLLDIPIIKNGSINEHIPPGTGPYVLSDIDSMRLSRNRNHRNYASLTISTIYLMECEDKELAELFDSGIISILWDDPADAFNIILNRHKETRQYNTTALQYIGYNLQSIVLRDADVRRAIGSSINRQYIVDTIMPGQHLPSQLALSPAYRLYDSQWEQNIVDPLKEMSALLLRAELVDSNNDSFLEYPNSFGGYTEISLDFIVNNENEYKVAAAHRIADTLRLYGIRINVRELPWDSFLAALRTRDFDMYYGEIVLGADFDLSPLLLPDSHLNFGLSGSSIYRPYIVDFMSAQSDEEEAEAAKALCDMINLNAPFIPLLYKRYVVYTHIGAFRNATPSQSGVFNGFADWTIDLTMLP
ncbi:MAG: ABC transporter substrate-binding protein [Oscillospiraceae bacterium]|nr:ABC transporter substrate-binding protein [Oscillospiraceae bacterium]